VAKVRVIYSQGDIVKILKRECDVEMSGSTISVTLSQADTLRLNCKLKTDIQIRVVTRSGEALASDIITVVTDRCLSDEVL
jgi:hypothetical protein